MVKDSKIGGLGLQHAYQLVKLVNYLMSKRELNEYMETAVLSLKNIFQIFQSKIAETKSAMMQGVDLALEERQKYSDLIVQQLSKLSEHMKAISRKPNMTVRVELMGSTVLRLVRSLSILRSS